MREDVQSCKIQIALKSFQSCSQNAIKLSFFSDDRLCDPVNRFGKLGIRVLHHRSDCWNHKGENVLLSPLSAVPDSSPHYLSQYVAATLIRRHHTIVDQKGCGACMVGYDPERPLEVRI